MLPELQKIIDMDKELEIRTKIAISALSEAIECLLEIKKAKSLDDANKIAKGCLKDISLMIG